MSRTQPGHVPATTEEQLDGSLQRQTVFFRTVEQPGTVIVYTSERHLYLVQVNNRALRYSVGVGPPHIAQVGMAGLDAASGNDSTATLSAALHGRWPR